MYNLIQYQLYLCIFCIPTFECLHPISSVLFSIINNFFSPFFAATSPFLFKPTVQCPRLLINIQTTKPKTKRFVSSRFVNDDYYGILFSGFPF